MGDTFYRDWQTIHGEIKLFQNDNLVLSTELKVKFATLKIF